jgi:signal transduction histidine kinase
MNLDKGRFRCLMENLLNRSLRLSPAQSVIDVSLSREGDQLILEISDPSSELSPAEVSALYAVDGANSHQSICRRIVHAHKGRISAKKDQAEPGLRTTIEFSLSDLGLPTL